MENHTKAGNLPTAEEFLINSQNVNYKSLKDEIKVHFIEQDLIEFAKLHLEAQREAIKKKATIKKRYDGNIAKEYWEDIVDEQSIDNAYDLNNIK